jgi:hypothetical protein
MKGAAFPLLLFSGLLCATEAAQTDSAFPITTWTQRLRQPFFGDISDIAFGSSRFVAVGARGTIIYSDDNVHWRRGESTPRNDFDLTAIQFTETALFVAVGRNEVILTSSDGISWNLVHAAIPGSLNAIAEGNGTYIAAGAGDPSRNVPPLFYTSNDASAWTKIETTNSFQSLSFGAGRFVGVTSAISPLGTNSEPGQTIMLSTNGYDWSRVEQTNIQRVLVNRVQFVNGSFFASGTALGGATPYARHPFLLESKDGATWTAKTFPFDSVSYGDGGLTGLAFGNGLYVAAVEAWTGHYAYTSLNAEDWVKEVAPDAKAIAFSATSNLQTNGIFTSVNITNISKSVDGINWKTRPVAPQGYTSVASGNNRFIALAPDRIDTSTNGIDWRTGDNTNGLSFVSFGFATNFLPTGVFLATGSNIVALSTNGSDWTYKAMPSNWLSSLVTPKELMVYRTGAIYRSTDGDNWTAIGFRAGASAPGRLMAFGNGRSVAVGSGFYYGDRNFRFLVFSESGILQAAAPPALGIPREIIFGAGTFVMSTTLGLYWSEDGLGWTLGSTNTSVENPAAALGYGRGWFSAHTPRRPMKISNDGRIWIGVENPFNSVALGEFARAQTFALDSMFLLTDKGSVLQSNSITTEPTLVLRVISGQISLYGVFNRGSYTLQGSDALTSWEGISSMQADPDNDTELFHGPASADGMHFFRTVTIGK